MRGSESLLCLFVCWRGGCMQENLIIREKKGQGGPSSRFRTTAHPKSNMYNLYVQKLYSFLLVWIFLVYVLQTLTFLPSLRYNGTKIHFKTSPAMYLFREQSLKSQDNSQILLCTRSCTLNNSLLESSTEITLQRGLR